MTQDDTRRTCTECLRCINRRCTTPRAAGIATQAQTVELGRDLATLPQNCPAFSPRPGKPRP